MKLKEIMLSCISKPREIEEKYPRLYQKKKVEFNVYSGLGQKNLEREDYLKLVQKVNNEDKIFIAGIINNILQKKVTFEDLKNLKELKKENKELFLEDLKLLVCDEALHELNKKIMKYALDLVDSKDLSFFLRIPASAIFRDLLFLEAKGSGFAVAIDIKGTLKINFPSGILELYELLINNFYSKKFEEKELQKKLYEELSPDLEIPFEKLIEEKELQKKLYEELSPDLEIPFEKLNFIENFIECLKEFYIKNSLAQSIMCLFVSKYIEEHDVAKELFESERFKKVRELEKFKPYYDINKSDEVDSYVFNCILNDVKGVYINNLVLSHLLPRTEL
ncbi:MAG: hypothetical protein RLZZ81_1204 [Pseudomonadota bacterium]|jgi:hypothetical protein